MRGAVALEFALVAVFFLLTLLVGIIELGRTFYYMNATAEATRWGARVAVVCDRTPATRDVIVAGMQRYLSFLPAGSVDIDYDCTGTVCRSATVAVAPGVTFETFIPFVPLTWTLPAFATTLPAESFDSAGGLNPVCQP